ncbi:uncharacterized protein LOC114077200 [Solanum pennellii]|uniref:Uncharacterized protein LOC114077200 n=1 Tax=Solanum pennellii TaxID=28526 RepID=A0ABM1VAB3_SOLPN|nr:uncharacterized protein LOC114077200 [Solanum pennellii]
MLSQVVTNQIGKQGGASQERADTSMIRELLRMNPQSFSALSTTEDLKNIVEELKKKQKGHAQSSSSAPAPRNKVEYHGQNSRDRPTYSQGSVVQGGSKPPACAYCARNHYGIYREGSADCFKCGHTGHSMKECTKSKLDGGNEGNRAQSSLVAPPDRSAPKGATSGTWKRLNCLYVITSRQEQENSPDVVTSMMKVFTYDVYALLD